MNTKEYLAYLEAKVKETYAFAEQARAKGLDPVSKVEIPIALSLAERATGLISTLYPQVADPVIVHRILELEKKYGSLDPAVALTIAEEIAKEKYCKFKDLNEAIEAGARIAIAYLTLGVVSSPIEGFTSIKLNKTRDGQDYFAPYFAGPIRSAGGTEAAFSIVIVDHLREVFGFAPYDPTEDEVKRGIHESYLYHERITNLQYLPSEREIEFMMRHVPVQVTGDPSEDREVFNFKDLPRIPTNFIRSGFALTLNEGLALKAPKILKRIVKLREKGFKLTNWVWMEDFVKLQKSIKENKAVGAKASATYIQDLVAGRPVFGHPSYSGAFRLRYGRCRNTGYSTLAIHPSAMRVSGNFIAIGTQLKIEKPTKGCTAASCDTIDPPIVRFKNGEVKQLWDVEETSRRYTEVEEIIYFGDLLIPYGDYANRNHALDKPGYVEQFWLEELLKAGGNSELMVPFEKAVELSQTYAIPFHPRYIYYWREISYSDFLALLDWLGHASVRGGILVFPYTATDKERFTKGKRALELIGCEHKPVTESIVLSDKDTKALLFNLGISPSASLAESVEAMKPKLSEKPVLELVNLLATTKIKDKSGTFIGSRMGRPEKAKLRLLDGSPHVLFPVGDEGGRLRSIQAAVERGGVTSDFTLFFCDKCKAETVYSTCENCGQLCKKMTYCQECDRNYHDKCLEHERSRPYSRRTIDIRHYFDTARRKLGIRIEDLPAAVKGVRGTSNAEHTCEYLGKGLLRAKYNLHVNKDGTIRYDMSEMPLTHFKPKEVGTSVAKLKELGYEKDISGAPLERDDQILEIFPHDVVLPHTMEGLADDGADKVFLNVARFIDDELELLYGLPRYFNAKTREDLVGAFLGCIAPHNCAAVTGRIIGFAHTQALLASPYIHAAMRRDCDGDEAAVMLLMDMLLNFSRKFLPSHRGGTQDAPLVLNAKLKAGEVDDMIFDVDVTRKIPLALYEAAELEKSPGEVKMEQVRSRLGTDREFHDLWYSYETSDINLGPPCSSYKSLPSMGDKVAAQMVLCKKIRAVDVRDVARLIIERHLIRDTRGNLRKFSQQEFRCVECNEKYRRPPLPGKCTKCGGKLLFTIAEGSVLKYMALALSLARDFNVSPYLLENLELTERYIHSIFGKEKERQEALGKWF